MKNIVVCKSFFKKGFGLMFRFPKEFAYIFPFSRMKKMSLHMLFVFFPIDIVFLDQFNEVVEVKESLQPFRFFTQKKKSVTFIEFPAGTIKKHSIMRGSTVAWSSEKITIS